MAGTALGGLRASLILAALAVIGWGAAAAQGNPGGSAGVAAVLACRSIGDAAQELACFRTASAALEAETSPAGPARVATATAPPAFGARPPRPPRSARAAQIKQVTVKLVSLDDPGDGRVVFSFDDGSTWREVEAAPVAGRLRPGAVVTLEHALLGSYLLDLPRGGSVRVARERGS